MKLTTHYPILLFRLLSSQFTCRWNSCRCLQSLLAVDFPQQFGKCSLESSKPISSSQFSQTQVMNRKKQGTPLAAKSHCPFFWVSWCVCCLCKLRGKANWLELKADKTPHMGATHRVRCYHFQSLFCWKQSAEANGESAKLKRRICCAMQLLKYKNGRQRRMSFGDVFL